MITNTNELQRLFRAFPGSFINSNLEFIADPETNQYFSLKDCETKEDIEVKILHWLSRAACKTQPYQSGVMNRKFHKKMQDCINTYLDTSFSESDFYDIYQKYGNGLNHEEALEFVRSLDPINRDIERE